MATDPDPYRTLGLPRDATLDEVRRAYRRLAKANHPDAAGEAALPRFLAIQAAYDTIAGPDARAGRPGTARPTSPRRPWDPDRDRTDATYRAYGGRSRRARPTGAAGAGRAGSAERPAAGPAGDRPPGTPRPPRSERPPNKATLGSTSYDGADAEPFEPDWRGASWYGTTSGTYWTLNPKEYADPRKHGPEYQARARRELDGRGEPDGPDAPAPSREAPSSAHATSESGTTSASGTTDAPSEPSQADPTGEPALPRTPPPPTHTTASWWEATAGDPPRPETVGTAAARPGNGRSYAAPPSAPASSGEAATGATAGMNPDTVLEAVRTWLDDTHPGTVGRIARALLGWAPIALGIGWAGGEMSGCGRFAAGCDDTVATSAWVVQIAVLLILIVVGRLARITSVATLATLVAAIPAALLLSATGGPDDLAAGRVALSGLLVIAWVVGLAFGIGREVRGAASATGAAGAGPGAGPPGDSDPAGPVS